MRGAGFPKPVAEIMATLTDLFRHQKHRQMVELLESSSASFDEINYDNWNGGTTTWALRLATPVSVFSSIERHLPAVEQEIGTKLAYLGRLFPNDPIGEITVVPTMPGTNAVGQRIAPPELDVQRLWPQDRFRLFLSHVSKHKVQIAKIKAELRLHGIAAFVAHEDIEPSREWQNEIELGLRSMHALVAFITPDFHSSPWTDQEIGWALGRGLLVVSVRLGADPYGFAGKAQAITADLEKPKQLAGAIVNILLAKPQTHGELRRAIAASFCNSTSYVMAQALKRLIVKIEDFTDEEKRVMLKACVANKYIAKAYYVPEAIRKAFGASSQQVDKPAVSEVQF